MQTAQTQVHMLAEENSTAQTYRNPANRPSHRQTKATSPAPPPPPATAEVVDCEPSCTPSARGARHSGHQIWTIQPPQAPGQARPAATQSIHRELPERQVQPQVEAQCKPQRRRPDLANLDRAAMAATGAQPAHAAHHAVCMDHHGRATPPPPAAMPTRPVASTPPLPEVARSR